MNLQLARLASAAVVLAAAGCQGSGESSGRSASPVWACVDASTFAYVPPDRDAQAADVSVVGPLPDGATSAPSAPSDVGGASQPPDPATWGCYADTDCSVFPDLPYCDGNRCWAASRTVTCTAGASANVAINAEVRHTFAGMNGSFVDACNGQGNLLQYSCETETASHCDMGCVEVNTGRVAQPELVDCVGACRDGRCDGRCPHQGDHVTFVGDGPDAHAIVRNDSDGRVYTCTIAGDAGCSASGGCPGAAETGTVTGLGLQYGEGRCTGTDIGTMAVAIAQGRGALGMQCGIVPICAPQGGPD
jgi:hypothetical protein